MCEYCKNYAIPPSELKTGDVILIAGAKYTFVGDGQERGVPLIHCPACGRMLREAKKKPATIPPATKVRSRKVKCRFEAGDVNTKPLEPYLEHGWQIENVDVNTKEWEAVFTLTKEAENEQH